jgi:hypothetical protein
MPHHAHVVHHIKGRVRIKVPAAKNRPDLIESIRKALEEVRGVNSAEANPLTGSLVLQYDPASHPTFVQRLTKLGEETGLFGLVELQDADFNQLATDVRNESEYLATHSKTAAVIINEVKKANIGIKKASDNTVDLNVLVPLGVAVYSALAVGLEAATPLWVTLAIFSFHSFVALHSTDRPLRPGETTQHVSTG